MAIDFDNIKDSVLYNTKEVCNFMDIKSQRYFLDIKKKYNLIPSGRIGKKNLYLGKDIKKFLKKRISEK